METLSRLIQIDCAILVMLAKNGEYFFSSFPLAIPNNRLQALSHLNNVKVVKGNAIDQYEVRIDRGMVVVDPHKSALTPCGTEGPRWAISFHEQHGGLFQFGN